MENSHNVATDTSISVTLFLRNGTPGIQWTIFNIIYRLGGGGIYYIDSNFSQLAKSVELLPSLCTRAAHHNIS